MKENDIKAEILFSHRQELENCGLDLAEFIVNRVKSRTLHLHCAELKLRCEVLMMRARDYELVDLFQGDAALDNRKGAKTMNPQTQKDRIHNERITRLLSEISRHVGRKRAIGMGELYEIVFDEQWANRINHTRSLRKLVTELRREGVPICADSSNTGGGYFLASATSELEDFLRFLHRRALNSLMTESKLRRISLPELLGQMQLGLEEGKDAA